MLFQPRCVFYDFFFLVYFPFQGSAIFHSTPVVEPILTQCRCGRIFQCRGHINVNFFLNLDAACSFMCLKLFSPTTLGSPKVSSCSWLLLLKVSNRNVGHAPSLSVGLEFGVSHATL